MPPLVTQRFWGPAPAGQERHFRGLAELLQESPVWPSKDMSKLIEPSERR